jgi:hypothetical protein
MKKIISIIGFFLTVTVFGQTPQEFYNKGTEKANSQDYIGSISEFDSAIKYDVNYTDAYYNRATSKCYIQDYKGAIIDFNKAIELRPDFINAFRNRGAAKLKLNDSKGAIADFDYIIKLEPNNKSVYFMRGQAKLAEGEADGGCEDLFKAKDLGDKRADVYIQKYCNHYSPSKSENKNIESLMIDWPDSEGWRIANQHDNNKEKMIELLRNKESFDNWTEIGTMWVLKNTPLSKKLPIKKTMDLMYKNALEKCPSAKITMLEMDEKADQPWVIYKIECSSTEGTESQVWLNIQGTKELFINLRAVKQATLPLDLQEKWITFFKTAKIVVQ